MKQPVLVIIAGPPGTGKTVLAQKIAQKYNLPLFSSDNFKEIIFDQLGWSNREWSKKVGGTGYALLYSVVSSLLSTGHSSVIEGNFRPEYDTKHLLLLKEQYPYYPFQIQLRCQGNLLFERFRKRSESANRHPGHVDTSNYHEYRQALLKGYSNPLEIGGDLYNLNTTDFKKINYLSLFKELKNVLS